MTKYLDELRKSRDSKLGDWVFLNTLSEPYTPSTSHLPSLGFLVSVSAAAWTAFVKACFAKHSLASTGKRKAPSASLTRSIFVTWLNGVPYDAHDSPFLQEIKVSAAEYQTHSLAIANRHYDKDAASEVRLRELVDFCDKYSAWSVLHPVAAASGRLGRLSVREDNLDSDDESFDSVLPLPRAVRTRPTRQQQSAGAAGAGAGSAGSASASSEPIVIDDEDWRVPETKAQASSAGRSRRIDSDDEEDNDCVSVGGASSDAESKEDKEQLYWPEHIIAKKTVRWKNYYLIHWRGFSESERTWEPAEFFDEYCTLQTTAYESKRVPVKIVAERKRSSSGSGSGAGAGSASGFGSGSGSGSSASGADSIYYEVQWQGQRETSLELHEDVQDLAAWAGVLKDWQTRATLSVLPASWLLKDWQVRDAQRSAGKKAQPTSQEGKKGPQSQRGLRPVS
jgi:hypothetical protein